MCPYCLDYGNRYSVLKKATVPAVETLAMNHLECIYASHGVNVEVFLDMKQKAWITTHVHMYEYFGGVTKILVSDNCKTAVIHNNSWNDQLINETYQEMAEHDGTAIIPARVRTPQNKPNAEGTVENISTWITAALQDKQFFSPCPIKSSNQR